jgi:hypothetical protein
VSGLRVLSVSTIDGFSSLLSSPSLTFLPEGVIVGFLNFAWGFNSQKIFGVKKKSRETENISICLPSQTHAVSLVAMGG